MRRWTAAIIAGTSIALFGGTGAVADELTGAARSADRPGVRGWSPDVCLEPGTW
jgi:hypothetical protein